MQLYELIFAFQQINDLKVLRFNKFTVILKTYKMSLIDW